MPPSVRETTKGTESMMIEPSGRYDAGKVERVVSEVSMEGESE